MAHTDGNAIPFFIEKFIDGAATRDAGKNYISVESLERLGALYMCAGFNDDAKSGLFA